jgi:threonine/homoserine/homoserine lactone efflux protein
MRIISLAVRIKNKSPFGFGLLATSTALIFLFMSALNTHLSKTLRILQLIGGLTWLYLAINQFIRAFREKPTKEAEKWF